MARPTPKDNARRAMFGWLTDKSIDKWAPATEADLPVEVQSLIAYRNSESEEAQALIAGGLDNVRWDLLSDAAKGPTVWAALARKMGPQALRMNLNTLLRHDVFNVDQLSPNWTVIAGWTIGTIVLRRPVVFQLVIQWQRSRLRMDDWDNRPTV